MTRPLFPNWTFLSQHLSILCAVLALNLAAVAGVQDDLVKAAQSSDLAKARRLLAAGAKADAPDAEGVLPLLTAVRVLQPEMVDLLLSKGADPNHEGNCGEAGCASHPAIVGAVGPGNVRIVKALLAAKANVAWREHWATRFANKELMPEIFHLLRAAGGEYQAGPDERERAGQTTPAPPPPSVSEIARLFPMAEGAKTLPGSTGKLRVAIIPDAAMQQAADLLAVELSGAGVVMLERADLQRIIEEQQLGGDFTQGGKAGRLGALAGADALVFLRQLIVAKVPTAEIRLVRTTPEVVLSTSLQAWPPPALEAWSKATASRLQSSLGRARRAHALALAIGDFRTTGVAWDARRLPQDAQTLLAPLLLQLPEVILLERASLAEVAREQALQGKDAFWAGSYLVDGTVEPPLTPGGEMKLTLRLQPTGGGAPLSFQSQGPPAEVRAILQRAVGAAAKALAMQPPTAPDLAAEATRHAEEATLYQQRNMPLSAWRSLELATLLGFKSPDLPVGRLNTGLGVIDWQLASTEAPGGDFLKRHGWSEAWLRHCLPAGDYLRPAEFMEVALQNARLWREQLEAALAADDLATVTSLFQRQGKVEKASIGAAETLNTVAGREEFGPYFVNIPREYAQGIAAVYAGTQTKPGLSSLEFGAAEALMKEAALLDPAPQALLRQKTALLAKHFATNDAQNRARLRAALLWPTYTARFVKDAKAAAETAVRPALLATLRKSPAADDQITARLLDYDAHNPKQEGIGNAELYAFAWEQRKLFVDDPGTLDLYREIERRLTGSLDPKYRNTFPPGGGSAQNTPAILDLRRRLYLEIAAKSDRPGAAAQLRDRQYHPANENVAEMVRLEQRAQTVRPPAPQATAIVGTPGTGTPAAIPPPEGAPPALVKSFAKGPRLTVARAWTPGEFLGVEARFAHADLAHLVIMGKEAWCYGGFQKGFGSDAKARLFRIELPSLSTQVIELPMDLEYDFIGQPSEGLLLVEEKSIFIGTPTAFLAYDRTTHALQRNPELHVTGRPVRAGADVFLLTGGNGATGIVRYTPATGKAVLLASNRRSPAQSPLDEPTLNIYALEATADGHLIALATRSPFDFIPVGGRVRGTVTYVYQPNGAFEAGGTSSPAIATSVPRAPRALTRYLSPLESRMVSLPYGDLKEAILPVDFDPAGPKVDSNAPLNERINEWVWTPEGYLAFDMSFGAFWFLPEPEIAKYVKETPSEQVPRPAMQAPAVHLK